ncbi:MAG TPA: ribonuclease III [Rhizomicrobium sp.]
MSELQTRLSHSFKDKDLLTRALTHASASSIVSNERLEFLGDRVLGLVIAEQLHHRFPEDPEGILALKLNALVRSEACAKAAEKVGLGEFLILANSEVASGGRRKGAILAGACEAVIAALYLDGGFKVAHDFILANWEEQFAGLSRDMRDAKTALQEWAQARKGGAAPGYKLIKREGPDHAPRFVVEASVAGQEPVTGEGSSKREAEQAAARAMLAKLDVK